MILFIKNMTNSLLWSCVSFNILQPIITYMKYQDPQKSLILKHPVWIRWPLKFVVWNRKKPDVVSLGCENFIMKTQPIWGEVKWAMGRYDLPRNNFESTSAMINQWAHSTKFKANTKHFISLFHSEYRHITYCVCVCTIRPTCTVACSADFLICYLFS